MHVSAMCNPWEKKQTDLTQNRFSLIAEHPGFVKHLEQLQHFYCFFINGFFPHLEEKM